MNHKHEKTFEEYQEEKAKFDLSLNILDIVAIVIAILAIVVSIFLATHTFKNRDANEDALQELIIIRKLLENNPNLTQNLEGGKNIIIFQTNTDT